MIVFTICGRISLRHLPKTKDKNYLNWLVELGFNLYVFSSWFDVTGLDLSADMLKIAEKRAASQTEE